MSLIPFSDTISQEIWIPPEKYEKLCQDINGFLGGSNIEKYSVKGLERIRGKVISFLIVNPGLKLRIREMTALLNQAEIHNLSVFTSDLIDNSFVFDELDCWLRLHNVKLSRKWYSKDIESLAIRSLQEMVISTDASTYQGGVHIEFGSKPGQIIEMSIPWSPHEATLDIACKEILMVKKVLEVLPSVQRKRLIFKVDNTVAVNSFKNDGCRNLIVTRIHKEILELAHIKNCHVTLDWISTHLQQADAPSRNILSHIDSRVNFSIRFALKICFPLGIDLFATISNRVYQRYFSRYEEFQSEGIFIFNARFCKHDFLYAYPPSSLNQSCLQLLARHPQNQQCMILHEFSSNALIHQAAMEQFDHRLLVGNRNNPCCLTTGKKLQADGQTGDYFRNYGEPLCSWMYFKNVHPAQIRRFHQLFCQQRHPLALGCNRKFLRRLFRIWRMITHRNLCADFRIENQYRQKIISEDCRDSSPFCLKLESLQH